jgi:Mg2+ and Co2+ transporter CorA
MSELLLELQQNQYGVVADTAARMMQTVEANSNSMVTIVEAYMLQCEGVESFYETHQEKVVANTLYMLTIVTVIILPIQTMTGLFGMNFEDMAELRWEYGYHMFWTLVIGGDHPSASPFFLNQFCMGLLYGRAGRLTGLFGGFRPGQALP